MTKKGKHTVLFICLGNICRSPAGEGIMKSLVEKAGLADEFEIDSAGIGNWHVGQLPDSRMRKCGAEHGYNFNSHARQFQKSDFGRFETIVVMDNENYRAITSMASCQADKDKVVRIADFLTHIMATWAILNWSSPCWKMLVRGCCKASSDKKIQHINHTIIYKKKVLRK